MTNCYSKLTRAILVPEIAVPRVAVVGLEDWISPYGIPSTIMTDRGLLSVSKICAMLFAAIGTKVIATMEYHIQSNLQTERFNKLLVLPLPHFIGEHQSNWSTYVRPLKNV